MSKRSRFTVPLALGLAGVAPSCRPRSPGQATVTVIVDRPVVVRAADVSLASALVPLPRTECAAGSLLARLRAQAVDRQRFAARTLYTWTTAEQADELRRGGPLLVREASPVHGYSVYDGVIESLAASGDRIALGLLDPRFRRARFAWTTPWPTLLGWRGETYGDRLLRVTLRDDAWVLYLTRMARGFEAVDMRNAPVPLADVLAHPERIGAVYFVNESSQMRGSYLSQTSLSMGRFREYVLPNEAMIVSWELDTPAVHDALSESTALASLMLDWIHAGCAGQIGQRVGEPWEGAPDLDDPRLAWVHASAFGNERYAHTAEAVRALIVALEAVPRGAPFVGETARVTRPVPPVARPARPRVAPRGTSVGGTFQKP